MAVLYTALVSAALTLALIHLLLFAFERRQPVNLYFTLLATAFAAVAFLDYRDETAGVVSWPVVGELQRVAVSAVILATARFVYALFLPRAPRRFWLYLLAIALVVAVARPWPELFDLPATVLGLLVIADILQLIVRRWRTLAEGGWLLGLGTGAFALGGACQLVFETVGWDTVADAVKPYLWGSVLMLFATSFYLARSFARLEAEDRRMSHELEEARRLQLALLPREVPAVPGLELAAAMRTATEVGGDYYDFRRGPDGALTVAIGDAVGHGARAGTLVTVAKSLFQLLDGGGELASELTRFSAAVRGMGLPRAHIALALARFAAGRLEVASAGMPPALVRRAGTAETEEIAVAGVPLGGPAGFAYASRSVALAPGDLVLLFSDGLPELPDRGGTLLGYPGARELFAAVPGDSARAALEALSAAVEARTGGEPPPDDVTMVVVRVR